MTGRDPLRVANSSGFFGDRFQAPRQMIDGGPVDVLTGDYLAELTMAILMRQQRSDPTRGYATTFLAQLQDVLSDCLAKGVKIVTNAGGLNPAGLVDAIEVLATEQSLSATVATVSGDDLMGLLDSGDVELLDPVTGEPLELSFSAATANAYLGGWGIARALVEGADIVVTGRVTDAALAIGPAAAHFGWQRDDWDRLAGALVAGHIIECGAQATGGNYSFFTEVDGLESPGFPIAEIHEDGSSVITKHPGTGGKVSVGTVTAQLLYEIGSPLYLNPDVSARLDTVELEAIGPDRVRVFGVRGVAPPTTNKVAITGMDGLRNSVTFGIAGLEVEQKAELAERALWRSIGGRDSVAHAEVSLIRSDANDPATNEAALAYLQVSVADLDGERVGRRFSDAAVELALSNYPGLFLTAPPRPATPRIRYRSGLVSQQASVVAIRGDTFEVAPSPGLLPGADSEESEEAVPRQTGGPVSNDLPLVKGPMVSVPLGSLVGARSGDKGGDANVGVWVRSEEAYPWIVAFLTVGRVRELLPETRDLEVTRYLLPNLNALNFVIAGLLGEGVADSTRWDPQAKGLGEYLRAKVVAIPQSLLTS